MKKIENKLKNILKEKLDINNFYLEIPPESQMGDFSLPCHQFSKELKRDPNEIAKEFSEKLKNEYISKIEVIGPYLNIFLNKEIVIKDIFEEKKEKIEKKEKVLIEFLSANPNKPLHIGQGRNICIGDSMVRISKYLGYRTDAGSYGDDSGVNVGYNLLAHLEYGYPLETEMKFDHYCGKIYTEMRQKEEKEEKENENFKEKLSKILLSIEKGDDKKILELHKEYTRKCTIAQFETCWKMNSFFNLITWETDILWLKFFEETFEKLKESGFVKYSDEGETKGTWILDLSNEEEFKNTKNPYQILVKSDGVATYPAKDIVYAIWKLGYLEKDFFYQKLVKQPNNQYIFTTSSEKENSEKVDFGNYDLSFAVIDNRQSYAQKVVKKALEILGYLKKGKEYYHISYGVVYLTPKTLIDFGFEISEEEKKEKKLPFSSRKGWFITIDETYNLMKKKVIEEFKKRNIDKNEEWINETSNKITLGAFRFYLLKTDIKQDIVFDIDSALDMKGDTGMYILYTFARISSIFKKIKEKKEEKINYSLLKEDLEWEIIKEISKKEEMIEEAFNSLSPNILCSYLLNLSQLFNSYYSKISIIKSEEEIKNVRLNLLKKIQLTLKEVMNLIGMIEVEEV
jgi:arginyl-tRNA synthetase